MRCPSCNKFASYDDPPTVEVGDTEVEDGNVSGEEQASSFEEC